MVIKKKINENQLKRIITESVKRILKEMDEIEPGFGDYSDDIPPQGFYICSETNYNYGNVETWIGDENDAQECRQCSEGSAYGPFSTYEEAEQYAEENGMNLGSEDYANNFRNALQDTFGDSLNENRLRKIVAKSVRKTLNEAFTNIEQSLDPQIIKAIENVAKSYVPNNHYDAYKELLFLKKNGYRVRGGEVINSDGKSVAKFVFKYGNKKRNLECPIIGVKVDFM